MKTTRILTSAILTTAILTTAGAFASSFRDSVDEIPRAAHEAWNATVFLDAWSITRNPSRRVSSTGTGTIVAQGPRGKSLLIATSAHVVACEGASAIRARFRKPGAGDTVSIRARVIWSDARVDLALLEARIPRGVLIQVASLADTSLADTSLVSPPFQVLAIGFPDLALDGDGAASSAKRVKVFSTGSLLEAPKGFRANYHALASTEASGQLDGSVLIHSAALLPGSSGGPLIDAQGRVIGINTGSLAWTRNSKCVMRATGEGPRCVHLAIPMGMLLEKINDWEKSKTRH